MALSAAPDAAPRARRGVAAALFAAIFAVALALRLASGPGADVPTFFRDVMGRAPRLDAYWYTRAAVERTRGDPRGEQVAAAKFDRPLYTALCRAVFAVSGISPRDLALPSILSGALGAALVFALGRAGGLRPGAAVLAGLFAATSWPLLLHDREPLVYSMANAAALGAILVWTVGIGRPALQALAWVLLIAVAGGTKETVLLAAPGLAIAQWSLAPNPRARRITALVLVLGGLAIAAASFLFARRFAEELTWKVATRTAVFDLPFPGGFTAALAEIGKVLGLVSKTPGLGALVFVGAAATLLEGAPGPEDRPLAFRRMLVAWLGAGALVAILFSYRPARYLLVLLPPAFLLAAHGAAVLAGLAASPVRRGPRACALIVFAALWLFIAEAILTVSYTFYASFSTLPAALRSTPARLGVAALAAAWIAAGVGPAAAHARRLGRARILAAFLVLFAFAADLFVLSKTVREERHVDLAARHAFEQMVGRGARVKGYAAHYLAFDSRYTPIIDFEQRPQSFQANHRRMTHTATFWVPELRYVEKLMEAEGTPLAVVADLWFCEGRYRVYRLPDAEAHGYVLTPFERARAAEAAGRLAEAVALYRALAAAPGTDPIVLAYAGAAIGRVAPDEGERLVRAALALAPWDPGARRALYDLAQKGDRAAAPGENY